MKFKKPLSALVVSTLLLGGASGALAASANLQLSLPTSEVPGGSHAQLTFTTNVPGFLTLTLNGPSGSLTLLDREEVHTAGNMFDFVAADDSGSPLSVGAYTVSGELIDQFGEATGSVSGQLTIGIPLAQQTDDEEEEEEDPAPANGDASASNDAASNDTASNDTASNDTASNDAATPSAPSSSGSSAAPAKPASSGKTETGVEYVASSKTTLGEQGYEIGVGVSDTVDQADTGYWGLTADASDADIWAALTRTMVSVNVGESESAYIYNATDNGKKIGSVSGLSQGLNLIEDLDDGWSVVEAYRNEDGAFVRGYIRTNKLRTVEPSNMYGLVIDKAAQTLTVYKNGERIGSCAVSTGLPTVKYLHRETPAGEFITVTRRGTIENSGGFSKYTVRISGNYHLCEIPTTKKNGKDYSLMADKLGQKASRGNICLAHDESADGGINAEWIWDLTDSNKKIKVLVFDDKDRSSIPANSK